jgi:hypothetical protein
MKSEKLGEGIKPFLQSRAHGDGNKPLLPSLVYKGWLVQETHLFQLLLMLFFLFVSLLPCHKNHQKKIGHKNLKQSQIKQKK